MKYLFIISTFILLNSCNQSTSKTEVIEEFNADGTIKSSTPVKNGMRNGTVKHYNEHGRLLTSVEYKDDKRHGIFEEYFPQTQKLVLRVEFKNDTQQGPLKQYYREGMLYRESFYVNGRVNGPYTTYWPNGKKREVVYFNMGLQLLKSEEFDKNEKLIKKYPEILMNTKDELALGDKISFSFQLSEKVNELKFYLAVPDSGKYVPLYINEIEKIEGQSSLVYYIQKGSEIKTELSIIAKYKTQYNNYKYLHKVFKLHKANRF